MRPPQAAKLMQINDKAVPQGTVYPLAEVLHRPHR
jgi:hypothetical protein